MRQFVQRGFVRHGGNGVYRDLAALGIALRVAVHHREWNFLDAQHFEGSRAVPRRNSGRLEFRAIGLRQHEPVTTEYEMFERDFGFYFETIWPGFCDLALQRDGHAQHDGFLAASDLSA